MSIDVTLIAKNFDGDRLRQARQISMMTKQEVAYYLDVSPALIGYYETGTSKPRPDLVAKLSSLLSVLPEFFLAGRPQAHLETSQVFFRSLRSTSARQRAKAVAYTEQIWELATMLEKYVRLPAVDIPDYTAENLSQGVATASPSEAARLLRTRWGLGNNPVSHLVTLLESKGVIITIVPDTLGDIASMDAFSTFEFERPIIVLSLERYNDVFRHRFSAAHELGHLVLHRERNKSEAVMESEANQFAAEFLMPQVAVSIEMQSTVNFPKLSAMSHRWGASIDSLIYRCRELGFFSETSAKRAFIRLASLRSEGLYKSESVSGYIGEMPTMLIRALDLIEEQHPSSKNVSKDLAWYPNYLYEMLGKQDERPKLILMSPYQA
ncbi:MAG: XRE family transcriptional regulator [Coriobacteriia bacterium]|nr:XRE family transcriptional regulator [Coriobacteriia bacterium]